MANLLFEDGRFKILRSSRNYIVVRKDQPYKFHSHFDKLEGAKTLIELYYKGVKPSRTYFQEAMRRICTEEEFESLREEQHKPKYNNKRR